MHTFVSLFMPVLTIAHLHPHMNNIIQEIHGASINVEVGSRNYQSANGRVFHAIQMEKLMDCRSPLLDSQYSRRVWMGNDSTTEDLGHSSWGLSMK